MNLQYQKSLKKRPKIEYIGEYFIRPIAYFMIQPFIYLRFPPHYLVLLHTCIGIYAGYLIYTGSFIFAALLIVIKTFLDAGDGQLARATNQVSTMGRYLDSEGDILVNLTIFIGIGLHYNNIFYALICFLIFTFILSLDFNLEFMYQECRKTVFREEPDNKTETKFTLFLMKIYDLFFKTQDVLIRNFVNYRFDKIYKQYNLKKSRDYYLQIYHEENSILILTNLGLAGQMLLLSLLLILGAPVIFLYFCVFYFFLGLFLQLYREKLLKNALKID